MADLLLASSEKHRPYGMEQAIASMPFGASRSNYKDCCKLCDKLILMQTDGKQVLLAISLNVNIAMWDDYIGVIPEASTPNHNLIHFM